MQCLVAVEPENIDSVLNNLRKLRPDIEFQGCDNVEKLFTYSKERPSVVLISRFLPGEVYQRFLPSVSLYFSLSHVVLLIGDLDEDGKTYVRLAEDNGLTNWVIGDLPGDRPYTLMVALDENRAGQPVGMEKHLPKPKVRPQIDDVPENPKGSEFLIEPMFVRSQNIAEGYLAVVSANKGGVGKTTAAITLAIALSNAGINVILVDLDFDGTSLTGFFNLQPERGMETLVGRQKGLTFLVSQNLISTNYNNLRVLPGVVNNAIQPSQIFTPANTANIVSATLQHAPVVIVDTPPGFWDRPWLTGIFPMADKVFSLVDQSVFSAHDVKQYAPHLLAFGVQPENIRIILNKFSPKLHNAKKIEAAFCSGFKDGIPADKLPQIAATIPNDWNAHGLKGYRGEVVGLDDARSQWHFLAEEIALAAGYQYKQGVKKKKKGRSLRELLGLGGIFS